MKKAFVSPWHKFLDDAHLFSPQRIYDASWLLLAYTFLGRKAERLCREIYNILLHLDSMKRDDLVDFLFDYRRAVGVALGAFILRKKIKSFKELLSKISQILFESSRDSEIGELVGASFLFVKYLSKDEELKKKLESLMKEIIEKSFERKRFEQYYRDILYIAFFSALADQNLYIEILDRLRRNEQLIEYIENDLEAMALLLFTVSRLSMKRNGVDTALKEWAREKRDEWAPELHNLANEIGIYHWIQRNIIFQGLFASYTEESSQDIESPYLNICSKVTLALVEAGYERPFTLSKYEYDVYLQIKGEIKRYKRVRKIELVFLFLCTELSVFLLYRFFLPTIIPIMFNLKACILALTIVGILLYSVWKYGQVPIHVLKDILNHIKNRLLGS